MDKILRMASGIQVLQSLLVICLIFVVMIFLVVLIQMIITFILIKKVNGATQDNVVAPYESVTKSGESKAVNKTYYAKSKYNRRKVLQTKG